jgi:CheY-like chemotaxis protein
MNLYLPRSTQAPHPDIAEADGPAPARGDARILIVDDDPEVRSVTAQFIQELGFEVLEAVSGAEALRILAQSEPPGLVIADVAMPEMNGIELANQMRAEYPAIPVLLVTGYADLSGAQVDFAMIHKPFQLDSLDQAIARLLRTRPMGA